VFFFQKHLMQKTVSSPVPLASEPVLRYVVGSTVKVEQLVDEEDNNYIN